MDQQQELAELRRAVDDVLTGAKTTMRITDEAVTCVLDLALTLAQDAQLACGIATLSPLTRDDELIIRGISERARRLLGAFQGSGPRQ